MRLPSASPARVKTLIHGFQAVLIFFAWALTIAVFTRGDGIDGRSGWFFGLVRAIFAESRHPHSAGKSFLENIY